MATEAAQAPYGTQKRIRPSSAVKDGWLAEMVEVAVWLEGRLQAAGGDFPEKRQLGVLQSPTTPLGEPAGHSRRSSAMDML